MDLTYFQDQFKTIFAIYLSEHNLASVRAVNRNWRRLADDIINSRVKKASQLPWPKKEVIKSLALEGQWLTIMKYVRQNCAANEKATYRGLIICSIYRPNVVIYCADDGVNVRSDDDSWEMIMKIFKFCIDVNDIDSINMISSDVAKKDTELMDEMALLLIRENRMRLVNKFIVEKPLYGLSRKIYHQELIGQIWQNDIGLFIMLLEYGLSTLPIEIMKRAYGPYCNIRAINDIDLWDHHKRAIAFIIISSPGFGLNWIFSQNSSGPLRSGNKIISLSNIGHYLLTKKGIHLLKYYGYNIGAEMAKDILWVSKYNTEIWQNIIESLPELEIALIYHAKALSRLDINDGAFWRYVQCADSPSIVRQCVFCHNSKPACFHMISFGAATLNKPCPSEMRDNLATICCSLATKNM